MTVADRKITEIAGRVRTLYARERKERSAWKRTMTATVRWVWMLYHEFLRKDVRVRAESLAFLMGMSLLPLIAGAFLIFAVFAQFGMVADAMAGAVDRFLATIPNEHREFVREYIVHFKDVYLATMSKKSGSIGIFALFFLLYIGVQAFQNVDRTINFIWSANRERPLLETVRNFLVVSVAAPLVLIAGLSVPIILNKIAVSRYVFTQVPVLFSILNNVVAPGLIFFTFTMLYRFVPVQRVYWSSALTGAAFSTVFLEISNAAMAYYFRFGTVSAYGKAAVVPLIGFWIYVVWIVVILGAEVSYLYQNEHALFEESDSKTSFAEGRLLLRVLSRLRQTFERGDAPPTCPELAVHLSVGQEGLMNVLRYLCQKHIVVETAPNKMGVAGYVLGKNIDELPLAPLMQEFYGIRSIAKSIREPDARVWEESLHHWIRYFDGKSVGETLG